MIMICNVPDEVVKSIGMGTWCGSSVVEKMIANGTPLPKGHGDLIDRSKIHKAIPAEEDNCIGMGMTAEEMDAYNDGIEAMYMLVKGAKPIIEASKEQE